MKLDEWPNDIEVIFQKPGRDWTAAERNQVIESLFCKERLPKLLAITRQHLGPPPPSPGDTEDALYEFLARKSQSSLLDKVINNYDPKEGRYLAYFMAALKNFLHRQGREERLDKDSESVELILPDHNLNSRPDLANECGEAISQINQCITNHLTEDQGKAFVARYFELRSYAEIAEDMGITEANARQLCHRASVHVKQCLEESSKPGGFDQ